MLFDAHPGTNIAGLAGVLDVPLEDGSGRMSERII
jgi:hypothetical protein